MTTAELVLELGKRLTAAERAMEGRGRGSREEAIACRWRGALACAKEAEALERGECGKATPKGPCNLQANHAGGCQRVGGPAR